MHSILQSIFSNIIKDGCNSKYRSLKLTNAKMKQVYDDPQGKQWLEKVGFQPEEGDSLILPLLVSSKKERQVP